MRSSKKKAVVGVSGGPDSVYLLMEMKSRGVDIVASHWNHSLRGRESDADQRFVEQLGPGCRVFSLEGGGGRGSAAKRVRVAGGSWAAEGRPTAGRERRA